jgi:multidrug efflux system membrane fusion protein
MRTLKFKLGLAAAIVVVAGAVFIIRDRTLVGESAGAAPAAAFAMPVPVAKIVKKTIPLYLEYSARTEAIQHITLQAKVQGYIEKQHVADGTDVKEGDLLYTIDPRDFQAALDQAKAQQQRDTAALDYARASLKRGASLAKSGFLAEDTYDQRDSASRQAQAALVMDEAAVRTAEINLGYTQIRAPFNGRLGRNQASVGTLVTTGTSVLNTLVQLDPIYVTFNPSETDLVEINKARMTGKVSADIYLPGQSKPSYHGDLSFLDNSIDRSTGTIIARATISNPSHMLLPGQYVRIRLAVGEQPDSLMVPQTAISSSQLGKYVYVVGKGDKVDLRLVSLGPTDGDLISVLKGVSPGDQVISGNLQKIGPGALVKPLP